jgi:uncharacterized membrane protein YuzA (DUF378 family)
MLKQACTLCKVVGIIAIISMLNWGLMGVANVNVIDQLLGAGSMASHVVYTIIGLAGIALLISFFTVCPKCKCRKSR